jgi:hypothetical protein
MSLYGIGSGFSLISISSYGYAMLDLICVFVLGVETLNIYVFNDILVIFNLFIALMI